MNKTNTLDIPTPLTEAELQHLWAPVPQARQQREEMDLISLRRDSFYWAGIHAKCSNA